MAKGEKRKRRQNRLFRWINGSIRRRLTLFVMLVCLLLIALVWVLVANLLEPMHKRTLRADLEGTLNTVVGIMDEYQSEGYPLSVQVIRFGVAVEVLTDGCTERIDAAIADGTLNVGDRSLDIGNENNKYLASVDTLPDSILHPSISSFVGNSLRESDGDLVRALRGEVHTQGAVYYELTGGQMVVGKTTADGRYTVIVAGNVERISEAVKVFERLMLPVSAVLVIVSTLAAWIFSGWFTSPLQRLSRATREVARGNYDVQVKEEGGDEISTLAGDFNTMTQEVKRSASLQRDLLANVSHDLRTPLTLIKGYAETVRDLTGDDKPKRDEQLGVIIDESDRLSSLVGRVLELSRVSSGVEKPEPVRFDLAQLCDEMGYRYGDFCAHNGCQFVFESDGPCEIVADPTLIGRALDNLLGNALHHVGEDGYIGLTVHRTENGKARVEIQDHGPGIQPEDLPYIFDKYYRSRANAGKTGTGLGLSITKAIFLAQNFDYGVNSQPGEGATFWFEAPLAE